MKHFIFPITAPSRIIEMIHAAISSQDPNYPLWMQASVLPTIVHMDLEFVTLIFSYILEVVSRSLIVINVLSRIMKIVVLFDLI